MPRGQGRTSLLLLLVASSSEARYRWIRVAFRAGWIARDIGPSAALSRAVEMHIYARPLRLSYQPVSCAPIRAVREHTRRNPKRAAPSPARLCHDDEVPDVGNARAGPSRLDAFWTLTRQLGDGRENAADVPLCGAVLEGNRTERSSSQ